MSANVRLYHLTKFIYGVGGKKGVLDEVSGIAKGKDIQTLEESVDSGDAGQEGCAVCGDNA